MKNRDPQFHADILTMTLGFSRYSVQHQEISEAFRRYVDTLAGEPLSVEFWANHENQRKLAGRKSF